MKSAQAEIARREDLRESAHRHHRRRERPRLRRRGLRTAQRPRLRAFRLHRRRRPLRAPGHGTGPRGLRPRHQRLLSRPGDPDAARSAVQRHLQLESRRRALDQNRLDRVQRQRRSDPQPLLRLGHPQPRAHDLHQRAAHPGRQRSGMPGALSRPSRWFQAAWKSWRC